jgi:hypothetical protein
MKILEDWEYPNDHIYYMERKRDIEESWQKWEENEKRKKRLPAIIKVTPILKYEAKRNTRTIQGTH